MDNLESQQQIAQLLPKGVKVKTTCGNCKEEFDQWLSEGKINHHSWSCTCGHLNKFVLDLRNRG